jgi:predicted nucleic acid-binding protein
LVIYLDSAAVVKLCHTEPATPQLVAWLRERAERSLVSSALVEVEVPRALHRHAPEALPTVPTALQRLYRIEIDQIVRATAAAYDHTGLRSLDAIHLATAQILGDTSDENLDFVTYDRRLLDAAERAGLTTASPGQN